MKDKTNYGYILGAALGVLLGALYFHFVPAPVPVNVTLDAKPAAELKREATVPVAVATPIQVYRPEVKKKLKLQAAIVADEDTHVVAASKTADDGRQHTVITTIDTRTGTFSSYDRVDERPWLAANTSRHFGVYAGALNSEPGLLITARQEILRIKALHIEGVAIGAGSRSEQFAFVGAGASW